MKYIKNFNNLELAVGLTVGNPALIKINGVGCKCKWSKTANGFIISATGDLEESVLEVSHIYLDPQGYSLDMTPYFGAPAYWLYKETEEIEGTTYFKYVMMMQTDEGDIEVEGEDAITLYTSTRNFTKLNVCNIADSDWLFEMERSAMPVYMLGPNAIYGFTSKQENLIIIEHSTGTDAGNYDDWAVNLGLTSGTKWAKYNVGITDKTPLGGLYQWGGLTDTAEPDNKDGEKTLLDWNNCPYQSNTSASSYDDTNWSKYHIAPNIEDITGVNDRLLTLDLQDDVAHQVMGGDWHMPTTALIFELVAETTSEWTTINGVSGRIFTGTKEGYTDNSIFIPAAGYRCGSFLNDVGNNCHLWSSSLRPSNPNNAWDLYFYSDNINSNDTNYRFDGLSVRGVL